MQTTSLLFLFFIFFGKCQVFREVKRGREGDQRGRVSINIYRVYQYSSCFIGAPASNAGENNANTRSPRAIFFLNLSAAVVESFHGSPAQSDAAVKSDDFSIARKNSWQPLLSRGRTDDEVERAPGYSCAIA